MTMASNDKNHETSRGAKTKRSRHYQIQEKTAARTGLDILCSSRIDRINTTDENAEKKITSLKHLLEKDSKAADLKWSLFVAASNTYRFDSCLKPFPPMYIKNECKDIEALVLL
jgi:poly[ADP-ribose] polymerase 16